MKRVDSLDDLLGTYFRAEMPAPWPRFQPPKPARAGLPTRAPARWRPAHAGRLALAASVGLLLLGSWLLPTALTPRPARVESVPTLGPGTAGKGFVPFPLRPEKSVPGKVKSSLHLEQGEDGRTRFKVTVEELPSNK